MKIYSSSVWEGPEHTEVKTPFDEFVGKNVWVACRYSESRDIDYTRFLYKDVRRSNWVVFTVDRISKRTLDTYREHPDYYHSKNAKYLTEHLDVDMHYLTLVEPVEAYTTAELFSLEDYDVNVNIVDRFLGKPYWVRTTRTDDHGEYFVKFLEKHGDSVLCDFIDTKYIDGYEYDSYDSYSEDWVQTELLHIDSFDLVVPMDVITEEEFAAELSAAEEEYERGFWEDHDEEEDEDDEE